MTKALQNRKQYLVYNSLEISNICVQEAEQKAAARADRQEAREQHARDVVAAAEAAAYAEAHPAKSPSFSCHSYELFVNQERGNQDDNTRERMSLRSDPFQDSVSTQPTHKPPADSHDAPRKQRKVSMVSAPRHPHARSLPMIHTLASSLSAHRHGRLDGTSSEHSAATESFNFLSHYLLRYRKSFESLPIELCFSSLSCTYLLNQIN